MKTPSALKTAIKRTLKGRGGVTLVELVMVMAIMGILSVAVSILLSSASNAYKRSKDKVAAANIGYAVWYDVQERIKNSGQLYLATAADPAPPGLAIYAAPSDVEAIKDGEGNIITPSSRNVAYLVDYELYGADATSVEAFYGIYSVGFNFVPSKSDPAEENYDILTLIITLTSMRDGTVYECEPYTFIFSNLKSSADGIRINDDSAAGTANGYEKVYDSSYPCSYLYYRN